MHVFLFLSFLQLFQERDRPKSWFAFLCHPKRQIEETTDSKGSSNVGNTQEVILQKTANSVKNPREQ